MGTKIFRLSVFLLSVLSAYAQDSFAADVTLAWDAEVAPTLAGYNLYYGTASHSYGTPIDVGNVTIHTVTGLQAGTYYFAVTAYDSSGYESGYSNEVRADINVVISAVNTPIILSNGATISWQTDVASDSQVDYGMTASYGSSTALNSNMVTSHWQSLTGLAAGTTYHYQVKSKTATSSLTTSGDFVFTTLTDTVAAAAPPVISSVASSGITESVATISWTTDKPSDSQIDYGLTTSYGTTTALDPSLVTSHVKSLAGLAPNTIYHYRVRSKDAAGIAAISGDFTFRTRPNSRSKPRFLYQY